ncbi:putative DNA/RNA polymerases superfamily protein [Cucumis melo var. makuwa]|uniref:DNA/RNA polymerases superfamily protein n=1 Tax=Cucumis melo var. makuwa TaxID=1194695 RepID=A0A5A7TL42_CUCMM|nr:putative DNA/RNA polymerases superfamily protein [Cucumis melo var. makuwa]
MLRVCILQFEGSKDGCLSLIELANNDSYHSSIGITTYEAFYQRQKSCEDNCHKALDFEVGDKVFVQLSPWKDVIRFGRKEKLSRRYIGPYEILACMGPMAYKSRFLLKLFRIDNVFHISMLEKNQDFTTKSITEMLMHQLFAWFQNLLRIALNEAHSSFSRESQCIMPSRVALARVPSLDCMMQLAQHLFLA